MIKPFILGHPSFGVVSSARRGAVAPSLDDISAENLGYISHGGNRLRAYDFAAESFADAVASEGVQIIDQDVHLLSDDGVAICHDSTVDLMTDGVGAVSGFDTAGFKALTIDYPPNINGYSATQNPMTMADLVAIYGNTTIYSPEIKASAAEQPLTDVFTNAGIDLNRALIQSFTLSDLSSAKAAGYQRCILSSAGTASLAAAKADGVQWAGLASSTSDADIASWVADFKVAIWTLYRRWRRDQLAALGAIAFFSDDAEYLAGQATVSRDTWGTSRKWMPGMLHQSEPMNGDTSHGERGADRRGQIDAQGWFGWNTFNNLTFPQNRDFVLQGWGTAPDKYADNNYDVEFTAEFTDLNGNTGLWLAIGINDGTIKDYGFPDGEDATSKGYNCFLRGTGDMRIYRRDGLTGTYVDGGGTNSGAVSNGDVRHYRLEVRPASVTLHRLDGSRGSSTHSVTTTDTTYRGGYFHLGRNSMKARFRDVIVTRY